MDEDYFEDDHELERERDYKVDEVKVELMATLFHKSQQAVFYERQIQVLYEDKFFHWITGRALHELSDERSIKTMKLQLGEHTEIRIYCSVLNRYWKRKQKGSENWCCAFQRLSSVGHLGTMLKQCSTLHYQLLGFCRKRKISVSTTAASGLSPNMISIVSLSEMPFLTGQR
jgi:hypothetical protein